MPIHLRPTSRREFLLRSLVAGAGLAVAPEMLAAPRRTAPKTWALLADTHVAADPAKVSRDANMADHFRTVSKDLLALPKRPAGVFVVGDLALNTGEPGDYGTFLQLAQPLRDGGLPLHLALGNHDQRDNFREALKESKSARRPVADKEVSLIRTLDANWFVLDSLEKTLSTPGLLGQAQLDWLAQALDANKSKPGLVLVHHNPGQVDNISGLKDTEALLAVLRPRRQVKAWIYGHTHAWKVDRDESGIHLVNLPPVAYVFKEGNPSGWVHATLARDGMRLELRSLDAKHPAHGQVVNLKWRAG
jgi:3',5'-cyclic-AMP phosphodiesterase